MLREYKWQPTENTLKNDGEIKYFKEKENLKDFFNKENSKRYSLGRMKVIPGGRSMT